MNTTTQYPNILAAAQHMVADQGGGLIPNFTDLDFANEQVEAVDLIIVDSALSTLSADELEALAIGCEDEWPAIYSKFDDDTAMQVHAVLDGIFCSIIDGNDNATQH